jgi:hypothetical protein
VVKVRLLSVVGGVGFGPRLVGFVHTAGAGYGRYGGGLSLVAAAVSVVSGW